LDSKTKVPEMKYDNLGWKKYLFEFLTIFIGVTLAFALTTWSERKNKFESAEKTILEIRNGLKLDKEDFSLNRKGHEAGISICQYFRRFINGEAVNRDTIGFYYQSLTRDYISIQNKSGYESLKSKGLELIKDDSLRLEIISLYDFYYELIEKLEETYAENQYHQSFFTPINELLAEFMVFDKKGNIIDILPPTGLSKKEKNLLMTYLGKIEGNRKFTIQNYLLVEERIQHLIDYIDEEIK